jgi:uncharacterized integral membrane protein (TIGR00697 family)
MKFTHRFLVIAAVFITCVITANVIAVKVISIGPLVLPAAIIIFPLSYIFGDVITEVYGYHRARQMIWLAYACNLLFVVFVWIAQVIPGAGFWEGQQAYETILGIVPRLVLASFAGGIAGEFANSFVLSRMKILTSGRWLWMRTIGSTIVGLKNMEEAIVPAIYDPSMIDIQIMVETEDAYEMTRQIVRQEGIFVGMSSGAAMYAAAQTAKKIESGTIVTIFPDRGEKYLSTTLFEK